MLDQTYGVILISSMCLVACSVSPQKARLNAAQAEQLQQARLVLRQQDTSAFSYSSQSEQMAARALGAVSPVSSVVSVAAGIRAATRGSEIQKRFQLIDPAKSIELALAQQLKQQYGLSGEGDSVLNVALDVRTTQWRPVYQLGKQTYALDYQADLSLMRDEETLTTGRCVYKTPPERQASLFTGILADNAKWLKQETEQAIEHCRLTFIQ
ncbi:hypothetical protein [Thiolinea disciformis]|uniref:hypothetical protein n=1 Tax=Thiolinea disciformis TaxID=125614 RepID=UPI00036ACCE7|nr:hypothetical protein [Thiolinea disciformis]